VLLALESVLPPLALAAALAAMLAAFVVAERTLLGR
jgi:hypothetical protein